MKFVKSDQNCDGSLGNLFQEHSPVLLNIIWDKLPEITKSTYLSCAQAPRLQRLSTLFNTAINALTPLHLEHQTVRKYRNSMILLCCNITGKEVNYE